MKILPNHALSTGKTRGTMVETGEDNLPDVNEKPDEPRKKNIMHI